MKILFLISIVGRYTNHCKCKKATGIRAAFNLEELMFLPVVINEINYKSSPDFDVDDWIELHNVSDVSIKLSNLLIVDTDEIPIQYRLVAF